ncbi:MAG: CHAP domain-containing protein [Atopobiaceae bacterium]|nr:CHAP domain-containing protein [Atopobiaceae bacterium]
MATADDVLRIAAGEVGYSRWDDPETGTKYGRWYESEVDGPGGYDYGANDVPYCAAFTSWVFDQANTSAAGLPGAYCPAMLAAAVAAGATVDPRQAQAGDIVYYDWDGDGESDHVGIVVANHGSYLETIEGNTSTGSGSQTNGGVVARRQRAWDYVCGIVRPCYSGSSSSPTETGNVGLEVDGIVGPLTVSEWQRQCDTPVDGVVSGQLSECRRSYPALTSVTFDGDGSALMREVQKRAGVPNPTGIIAGGTVCMLQGWLVLHGHSCASDHAGILGEATARALQESLNEGEWKA